MLPHLEEPSIHSAHMFKIRTKYRVEEDCYSNRNWKLELPEMVSFADSGNLSMDQNVELMKLG